MSEVTYLKIQTGLLIIVIAAGLGTAYYTGKTVAYRDMAEVCRRW